MKKIILAIALTMGSFYAQADEVTNNAVKEMVAAYKKGKSSGMREEEKICWSAFKPNESDSEAGLSYCAMFSFIGHLIEDIQAERQGKKLTGYWSEDSTIERIVSNAKRLKVKEEDIESLMESAVVDSAEDIAKALAKHGYSY